MSANRAYGLAARKGTQHIPKPTQPSVPAEAPNATVASLRVDTTASHYSTASDNLIASLERPESSSFCDSAIRAHPSNDDFVPLSTAFTPPAALADWACVACTFIHEGHKSHYLMCEVCATPRPLSGTIPLTAAKSTSAPPPHIPSPPHVVSPTSVASPTAIAPPTPPASPTPEPVPETAPATPESLTLDQTVDGPPVMPRDLNHFLKELGITRYLGLFETEEVDLDTLFQLTEADLAEIGLPMGPRKKIICRLRKKLNSWHR